MLSTTKTNPDNYAITFNVLVILFSPGIKMPDANYSAVKRFSQANAVDKGSQNRDQQLVYPGY